MLPTAEHRVGPWTQDRVAAIRATAEAYRQGRAEIAQLERTKDRTPQQDARLAQLQALQVSRVRGLRDLAGTDEKLGALVTRELRPC